MCYYHNFNSPFIAKSIILFNPLTKLISILVIIAVSFVNNMFFNNKTNMFNSTPPEINTNEKIIKYQTQICKLNKMINEKLNSI